jgi:hypothetical protein
MLDKTNAGMLRGPGLRLFTHHRNGTTRNGLLNVLVAVIRRGRKGNKTRRNRRIHSTGIKGKM